MGRICSETGAICLEEKCLSRRRCLHPRRLARAWARRKRNPQRKVWDSARWKRVRKEVKARDGCCRDCGAHERLSVHHLVALVEGGAPFDPANCVTLCSACHGRREGERRRASSGQEQGLVSPWMATRRRPR